MNKISGRKIAYWIVSVLLFLVLAFLYYRRYHSLLHSLSLILPAIIMPVLFKNFKPESIFRCLSLETALLPYISFRPDFTLTTFGFSDFKNRLQVVIMFANHIRILAPLIVIAILFSYLANKEYKFKFNVKYILITIAAIILFVAPLIKIALSDICLFVFIYLCIFVIAELSEKNIYKENRYMFLTDIPFYFLVITAYFNLCIA